ncbi:MAG: cyclic nucleotide-binding domain-containing protein [Desulfobacterales bacterium]
MYFKQRDLFESLGKEFVSEIMNTAETESHQTGDMLFHEGDPATGLFILLKGSIKLRLGQTGRAVYLVSHPGEVFGWSSLVGRSSYSASAECITPTKLLRLDKNRLQKIIQKDAASSATLFQNLAAILGNRLIRSYELNISATGGDAYASVGTGQVMETAETELEV